MTLQPGKRPTGAVIHAARVSANPVQTPERLRAAKEAEQLAPTVGG